MKRFLTLTLLLAFAAPLSGCGISGGLKTAPPLWGDAMAEKVADDAAADGVDGADATPERASDNPLDDDDDEIGYGVDVADTP
jgi:hypothetical protein